MSDSLHNWDLAFEKVIETRNGKFASSMNAASGGYIQRKLTKLIEEETYYSLSVGQKAQEKG
jgi:hypothetical protein